MLVNRLHLANWRKAYDAMPTIHRLARRLLATGMKRDQGARNTEVRLVQWRDNSGTHYRSGALRPKPPESPFGMLGVICAVMPGLFVGAAISKSVANFLEENELFIPADDDDDDD